jgi:uncharacterized protein
MEETRLNPVAPGQRIGVLDALRGFAIFGILVVNVLYFFNPLLTPVAEAGAPFADRVVKFLTTALFDSKFYTTFSFLFGLGMYIQWSRAQERGVRFLPLYLRRLLVLALFGAAHGVLLWTGDILFLYAIAGTIASLLFIGRSPKTLLVWAIVLIALPLFLVAVSAGLIELARSAPAETGAWEEVQQSFAAQQESANQIRAEATQAYTSSSWLEVTRFRVKEFFGYSLTARLFTIPTILGMFLLGIRAGRKGWFTDLEGHLPVFRRLFKWALPVGLVLSLLMAGTGFEQSSLATEVLTFMHAAQLSALNIGGVLLALSYISLIVLVSRSVRGAHLLGPFRAVGRMALTNYILQSLVMSTLAYGYGAGLFNSIGLLAGFLLAIGLYVLQVPLSTWWLSRRRYGPLEWLWRVLTYGRRASGR